MAWIDYKKVYDTVPQSWILHCLKMYKIPYQVVQFTEKTMKTWTVELTAERKCLAVVKIQRGVFQGEALLPLLFEIAMMPLNHVHGKCTSGYNPSKSQEKINHLMYMNEIKLFAKNEKELETHIQTVRIYNQDIGMEFGIEKCAMFVMKSDKRHITEGGKLPSQIIIRSLREKETYKCLGISWKLISSDK